MAKIYDRNISHPDTLLFSIDILRKSLRLSRFVFQYRCYSRLISNGREISCLARIPQDFITKRNYAVFPDSQRSTPVSFLRIISNPRSIYIQSRVILRECDDFELPICHFKGPTTYFNQKDGRVALWSEGLVLAFNLALDDDLYHFSQLSPDALRQSRILPLDIFPSSTYMPLS